MPIITVQIDTDTQAVVPREPNESLRRVLLEWCSSVDGAWKDILNATPQPDQAQQSDDNSTDRAWQRFQGAVSNPGQHADELDEQAMLLAELDDLAMLARRLAHALRKASPDNDLSNAALGYLAKRCLLGAPLRDEQQSAPRPAFYVDKQKWLSCTHKVPPCEIPVWCRDADVVMKLMLGLSESRDAPRPVPINIEATVREILDGIDRDSHDDSAWWETSTGAEFGRKKLDELLAAIGAAPRPVPTFTPEMAHSLADELFHAGYDTARRQRDYDPRGSRYWQAVVDALITRPITRPVPTSEFERGALTAIALIIRCHDSESLAFDILNEMGLNSADCSDLDERDKEDLSQLIGYRGTKLRGLTRPPEPDGGAV